MTNDREEAQQHQTETGSKENPGWDRIKQFIELSELSLEERMRVAAQLGIPMDNVGDVAVTGHTSGNDNAGVGTNDRMKEETKGE